MRVDQPRQDHFTPRVYRPADFILLRFQIGGVADVEDTFAPDRDVAVFKDPPIGIHRDDRAADNQQVNGVRPHTDGGAAAALRHRAITSAKADADMTKKVKKNEEVFLAATILTSLIAEQEQRSECPAASPASIEERRSEDPFPRRVFRRSAEHRMTFDGFRLDHPPVLVDEYRHLNFPLRRLSALRSTDKSAALSLQLTGGDALRHSWSGAGAEVAASHTRSQPTLSAAGLEARPT